MNDGPAKYLATPNTREETPTGTETLLVYKLLDVDEKTLFYWVKAVTGIWPLSIHLSVDEEQAVIKIPLVNQGLGEQSILIILKLLSLTVSASGRFGS